MKTILRIAGALLVLAGLGFCGIAIVKKPVAKAGADGLGGDLSCRWQFREKVITGAYKVYGLKDSPIAFWLAKSVFKNESPGVIKDLKVRYKLGDYADWCAWQTYPELVPSQTVVDLFFPILASRCAQLSSQTPAELLMEYEYVDAGGHPKQAQMSGRLTLMGRREFFFTDLKSGELTGLFQDKVRYSPLLAAWVTSADMPVSGLASMANKRAGGVGAGTSSEDCRKVMQECYEIMRDIGITYQHPAARLGVDKSYDPFLVQSLQYPRDTIEKRSGTCIDLAILYAAMLDSVGVEPVLVSLQGHCFPMGIDPKSGRFIPVEATCVGGLDDSQDFATANKVAAKEWADLQQSGRFALIKCQDCWSAGISQPELDPLPADTLERWGIRGLARKANQNAVARVADPQPGGVTPMAAGQWSVLVSQPNGTSSSGMATVAVQGQQVQMVYIGQYQMKGYDGNVHQAREQNAFVGAVEGQALIARCQQAVWTMDGQNVTPQGLPLVLTMTLGNNGRSARGSVANAMGQSAQVTMEAQ
jgi:hypothetical protein